MSNSLLILSMFITDEKEKEFIFRFIIVQLLISKKLVFSISENRLLISKSDTSVPSDEIEKLIISHCVEESITLHNLLKKLNCIEYSRLDKLIEDTSGVSIYRKKGFKQWLFGYKELKEEFQVTKTYLTARIRETCKELRKRNVDMGSVYRNTKSYIQSPLLVVLIAKFLVKDTIHSPSLLFFIKSYLIELLKLKEDLAEDISNVIYYIFDSTEITKDVNLGLNNLERSYSNWCIV